MKKRLFIFAGYDAEGRVQDYVVRYASALGALGDVIFYMDNDAAAGELDKIRAVPGVIFAGAERHKEYDFGSYKRGYQYARCGNSYPCGGGVDWRKSAGFRGYEFVYFVNDSVFGPFAPLEPLLEKMESSGADLFGMAAAQSFIQSWFFGMPVRHAKSEWFTDFINGVRHWDSKLDITFHYERGLSKLFRASGFSIQALVSANPYGNMIALGIPFIKKLLFFARKFGWPEYRISARRALESLSPADAGMICGYVIRNGGGVRLGKILGQSAAVAAALSAIARFFGHIILFRISQKYRFSIRVFRILVFGVKRRK